MKNEHYDCSINTIIKSINYLKEAYVENEKEYLREMDPFSELDNANKKIFITLDPIYSSSTVQYLKFKDFLICETL